MHQRTSQRRQHTFAALRLITNRINRRLARGIPFPPASTAAGPATGAHEVELNFEAVLDGRALLERQLDPGLHALELLKREKKRIEGELEKEWNRLFGCSIARISSSLSLSVVLPRGVIFGGISFAGWCSESTPCAARWRAEL